MGTEFKVGVFSLLALVVIGYMFFVLSPDTFKSEKYSSYYTILKDAGGIAIKTHVKTNGVIVGQVKAIKLLTNSTRIEIDVFSETKIPVGSEIEIKEKGLLGDVFMEITRSDDHGQYHKPGDFIAPAEDQASISKLIAVAGSIGKDIKKITSSLANVIGGEAGEKNIADIVGDIKEAAANLKGILKDNRNDVRVIVTNVKETTDSLSAILGGDGNKKDLKEVMGNIKGAVADLRDFSSSLKYAMRDENVQKVDAILAKLDKTMDDVGAAAKSVRVVTDKVEKGEGTIGRLLSNDEAINEFEGAIKDVREVLAPAVKLQTAVDFHSEFRKDQTSQHFFNVKLSTRPDKFYLLGFTDVAVATREVATQTLETEPVDRDGSDPRKYRETIVERKALRFNLQMGKRWGWFQMRFGLFETTGGFASDMFLLSDRLRFTVEAFDWQNRSPVRRTAHLKGYLSVLFYNHVFAMIGLDDVSRLDPDTDRVQKNPNYFVGAGLSFDDQDLKAMFGTAALVL